MTEQTNLEAEVIEDAFDPSFVGKQPEVEAEQVQDISIDDINRAKELFGAQRGLNQLTKLRKEITNKFVENLGSEEIYAAISEKLKLWPIDVLKQATDEQVNELFSIDGKLIDFEIKFNTSEREMEFRRDFLVYIAESQTALAQIDEESKKLDETLESSREEFNALLEQFGDLSAYIIHTLHQQLEKSTDEGEKIIIQARIDAYNDSISLDRIVEYCKQFNTKNIIADLKDDSRANRIYGKYMKAIMKLGIRTDLAKFNNLEVRVGLPEKYQAVPNLFMFTIIKYIGFMKNPTPTDGIFLTQLSVNISNLLGNSFEVPEKKDQFLVAIQRVLDLFY